MKLSKNVLAASILLGVFTSTASMAQDEFATAQEKAGSLIQADLASLDIEQRLALNEAKLSLERAKFEEYFADAYGQYPALPAGILEALAYVQSRWVNMQPGAAVDAHQHMPRAYGVMGLYQGEGFRDQVAQAAQLLGVEPYQVLNDAHTNILAAAALLNELLPNDGKGSVSLEAMAPVLAEYAGFADVKNSEIQRYARDNFSYDVLLTLDRGFNDNGIKVPEKPIAWEQAFSVQRLVELRAPFVRLDATKDQVLIDGYQIDPINETLIPVPGSNEKGSEPVDGGDIRSTDYGPALYVQSPYHTTRTQSISQVTMHTMEGSYAGTISWFQNNPYSVSAHYLVRSSDGQITQMVRESRRAHHVGVHNSYTLGIEHEGFVANGSSWYTTAMYNASSALTKHFCSRYGISCASAYSGPAHSGVVVLSSSIPIKGHQHYSSNTHVDPGIFWDWSRYYTLLNGSGGGGGGGGTSVVLDTFESSEGHFTNTPAYSGSTTGISTASTADRTCSISRVGNCSEQIRLVDNASSSANWAVRFLSGGGSTGANTSMNRNGRIGFWVYTGGTGMSVGVGIDDSDGTERSTSKSIPANSWTFVEWNLADAGQWNAWVGGNGAISATNVTMDAIWLYRAQTSFDVYVYLDDVRYTAN